MKAQAIKDLHFKPYLKILSNCARLKADVILREFANITCIINPQHMGRVIVTPLSACTATSVGTAFL